MNKIILTIKAFFFATTFLLATPALSGQPVFPHADTIKPSYSDQELRQFVNAVAKVMTIQEEGQMLMIMTIQENELSLDRFNEMIMEAQVNGPENVTATSEEMIAFHKSLSEVQTLQMQLQELMVEAITEEGLQIDQYQGIMQAYEDNPEIKEKIDNYFAEFEE
jgi:hypothetical protein